MMEDLRRRLKKGTKGWFLFIHPATLLNLPSEAGGRKEGQGRKAQ